MKFSVVGLPHYTIWHLYEPSVDDIRHMEEMEKERKAKEAEEAAKKERMDKIKDQFDVSKSTDWEKEKAEVQDLVQKAKNEAKKEKEEEKRNADDAKKADDVKKEADKAPDKNEDPKEAPAVQKLEEAVHNARGEDEKSKPKPVQ